MAERGSQDKTEKPTPRRRHKSREQGQVAKSQELNSVAVLLAGLSALWFLGGYLYNNITSLMRHVWSTAGQTHLSFAKMNSLGVDLLDHFFKTVGPVWISVFLVAILINIAQVGFLVAPKRLKPDLKKINPFSGFKRWFSLRTLVEAFKNIGKLLVVATVAYLTVRAEWPNLPKLAGMEIDGIVLYIVSVCFDIFLRSVLAMTVLAFLDWAYQKWEFEKNLKMSKQEIKDEYKQTEGDPRVRARIRAVQREQAKKRMMAGVPEADVVITNPVHLAVALVYNMSEMDAPEVVAKGANRVAEKIKEIARQHGVPVIENKPLAQALYKAVEVGQGIPPELFEATATVLAHVYRMKNMHKSVMQSLRASR